MESLFILDFPKTELIPVGILLAVTGILLLTRLQRPQTMALILAPALLLLACGAAVFVQNKQRLDSKLSMLASIPSQENHGNYVSSDTCRACHPGQYQTWHDSYHRTMTQVASPEAVQAKWDGQKLKHGGEVIHLEQKDAEFWVKTFDANGRQKDSRRVGMLTGSHHMQAFWLPSGQGNIQDPFPFAWLIAEKKWVPLGDTFLQDPSLPAPDGKWNKTCINCHAVAGQFAPNLRAPGFEEKDSRSRTAEFGISCEACHGEGEKHIAKHRNPLRRYQAHHDETDNLIVNPAKIRDHRKASQVCGQCHGIKYITDTASWAEHGFRYRPKGDLDEHSPIVQPSQLQGGSGLIQFAQRTIKEGGDTIEARIQYAFRKTAARAPVRRELAAMARLHDDVLNRYQQKPESAKKALAGTGGLTTTPEQNARLAAWLTTILKMDAYRPKKKWLTDRFWRDGMVRVSGREYNGLIDSPCYQHGTLSCLSCHTMHDNHSPGWKNDQLGRQMETNQACLQCHGEFRDNLEAHTRHTTGSSGSLCYNCHMPHTTYGLMKAIRSHQVDSPSVKSQLLTGRPNACNLCHLDKTLAWTANHLREWYEQPEPSLRKDDQSVASMLLMLLKGDAGQRALAAWHMGWEPAREVSGDDWIAPYLIRTMNDPYATVRFIAHRSLKAGEPFLKTEFDYAAEPVTREKQIVQLQKIWQANSGLERAGRSELLQDEQGLLITDRVSELVKQRNNRSMDLQE